MIGIFLDDERNPEDVTWIKYPKDIEWYVLRRMCDFQFSVMMIEEPFIVSFDHDLQDFTNGVEHTGYDCVKWLVDYCIEHNKDLPICFFHTKNPIGLTNMLSYMYNAETFLSKNKEELL